MERVRESVCRDHPRGGSQKEATKTQAASWRTFVEKLITKRVWRRLTITGGEPLRGDEDKGSAMEDLGKEDKNKVDEEEDV